MPNKNTPPQNNGSNDPVWLEAALNGATGQALQPNIPITAEAIIAQGVACAKAGAAIIHMHAYDPQGKPTEDADTYATIIEGICSQTDAIVYPTLALSGSIDERLAPLRQLAERGLLEWLVVDPGSVNITHSMQSEAGLPGLVYSNPDQHINAGLAMCCEFSLRPAYAIYEPGFARLGAALAAQHPDLQTPIYRLMFSDNFLFGCKPSTAALNFYAQHLDTTAAGAPRMISGLDADVSAISDQALSMDFHLRVGLEDAPLGCAQNNIELVEQAAARIERAGRRLASPAEIRASALR